MINPDNFVFHSDFWYPTGYLSGTKEYNNVSIPAQFEMTDQYEEGDFYNVYLEYPGVSGGYGGGIGERFLSDTIIPYTQGNKLMVFKGAQSVGATFTAKLHWRLYKRNKAFNFLSLGNLEQTAKTLDGFITAPGGVNSFQVEIPSGLTGKYFPRGTWQIEGQPANIINGQSGNGDFNVNYDLATNAVKGFMTTYPGVLPAGTKIYYKIQMVPIVQDSPYIFNSEKYSFAIPSTTTAKITDTATLGAGATRTVYGDWIDVPGEKIAYDLIVSQDSNPAYTQQHYAEFQIITNAVSAVARLEGSGNRVRPVLTVTNYSNTSRSYTNQSFTYRVFMYQNNNA